MHFSQPLYTPQEMRAMFHQDNITISIYNQTSKQRTVISAQLTDEQARPYKSTLVYELTLAGDAGEIRDILQVSTVSVTVVSSSPYLLPSNRRMLTSSPSAPPLQNWFYTIHDVYLGNLPDMWHPKAITAYSAIQVLPILLLIAVFALSLFILVLRPTKVYLLIPLWDVLQLNDLLLFCGANWSPYMG